MPRQPTWEQSPGALAALLNSREPLQGKEDAYTITLPNGTVLRWSGSSIPLQIGGDYFTLGPIIQRTRVRFSVGISTDKLTLTLNDTPANPVTVLGVPLVAFARARGFDNATLTLQRAFWGMGAAGPVGAIHWFTGVVDGCEGDSHGFRLTVSSFTKFLEVPVPGDVYQSGCLNDLFAPKCGLNRSVYTVNSAATSGSNSYRNTFGVSLPQAAGWFDLGGIAMTSGLNAGISRTVKAYGGGLLSVLQPWPYPIAAGDSFSMYPGCDKTSATCTSKFNNRLSFRGQELIPTPETAY